MHLCVLVLYPHTFRHITDLALISCIAQLCVRTQIGQAHTIELEA